MEIIKLTKNVENVDIKETKQAKNIVMIMENKIVA